MSGGLLVTGGDGLLGTAVRKLRPEATFVTRRDCDLTDPAGVEQLFAEVRPAQVLHLAARVGGVKTNAARNADLFTENVQVNTNVLAVAQRAGVERLVAVLCSCAFAMRGDRPCTEDDLHEGMPYSGNLGYGYSKRMLDIHAQLLAAQHGARFSTISPVTMYGPHDSFDLEDGHVVGAMIHKCALALAYGDPLVVWGSGNAVRQFVFAPDVAAIALRELDQYDGPGTVIIAPDRGVTIRELVETIGRVMRYEGPLVYDRSKPEGQSVKVLQGTLLGRRYPEYGFTDLEQGLAATVSWFVERHPEVAVRSTVAP